MTETEIEILSAYIAFQLGEDKYHICKIITEYFKKESEK